MDGPNAWIYPPVTPPPLPHTNRQMDRQTSETLVIFTVSPVRKQRPYRLSCTYKRKGEEFKCKNRRHLRSQMMVHTSDDFSQYNKMEGIILQAIRTEG